MNTNTGELLNTKELQKVLDKNPEEFQNFKQIDPENLSPRVRQQLEETGRSQISRNSPCPCGSRKRFKRCCMTEAK